MIDDVALGTVWTIARIDAARVTACQSLSALVVTGALGPLAMLERIAKVAFLAVTASFVVAVDFAQSIRTALSDLTGVDALVVNASLTEGTLVVSSASN